MPAPTGWGVPQPGDRSARNTHDYADLHASDHEEDEHTIHVPLPGAVGGLVRSDGTYWRRVDGLPHSELTGVGASDHHSPVTLSAEAADILALLDQELDLEAQAANTVLAGPASGAAAKPTFRAIVAADLGTGTPDGTKFLRDDLTWQFAATDGGGGGSGAPAGYAETIGDGVNTAFTITHDLDTTDVMVQVYDLDATPYYEQVSATVEVVDGDTVQVTFLAAPSASQYRVVVIAADVALSADAGDITYTPAELTDWDSDADPGDLDDALDQLAERVDDLEGAGGGNGYSLLESRIGLLVDPLAGTLLNAQEATWVRVLAMADVTLTRVRAAVYAAGDDIRCRVLRITGSVGNATVAEVVHETAYQAVSAPEFADFAGLTVSLDADTLYAVIIEVETGSTLRLYQNQSQLGYGSLLPTPSNKGGYCARNVGVAGTLTEYSNSLPIMWLTYEL